MKAQKTAFSLSVAAAAVFGLFAAADVRANDDLAQKINSNTASIRQNVIILNG